MTHGLNTTYHAYFNRYGMYRSVFTLFFIHFFIICGYIGYIFMYRSTTYITYFILKIKKTIEIRILWWDDNTWLEITQHLLITTTSWNIGLCNMRVLCWRPHDIAKDSTWRNEHNMTSHEITVWHNITYNIT